MGMQLGAREYVQVNYSTQERGKLMKYTLLQRPIIKGEDTAPIDLVDNSTPFGKRKVEKFTLEYGYKIMGVIESNESLQELKRGFDYKYRKEQDKRDNLFCDINEVLNKHLKED